MYSSFQKYKQAISCLPEEIFSALSEIDGEAASDITEIRLRSGMPLVLIKNQKPFFITPAGRLCAVFSDGGLLKCSKNNIDEAFRKICEYSVYSHTDDIRQGYITIKGGHRAGICGTAVIKAQSISTVHYISSINLRIAGEHIGAADKIIKSVFINGAQNLVICGPPASGKTTILRDLARQLSNNMYLKTAIIDERGEIAASLNGINCNNVGYNTDVLNGYPKDEGISCAVRSMSPEIIICDEIGSQSDLEAIESGLNSGVYFVLSIHSSPDRLRPQLLRLAQSGSFNSFAMLSGKRPGEFAGIYSSRDIINAFKDGDYG